jgi:hypothetical protein
VQTGNNKQKTSNQDALFNYMDKVYNSFSETLKSYNRLGLSYFMLTSFIVLISLGAISVNSFTMLNINLIAPLWLILIGGVWVNYGLILFISILGKHLNSLENTLLRLYKSVGYEDKSMFYLIGSPIRRMTVRTSSYCLITLLIFFVLSFPLISSIFAFYKLIYIFGWVWWMWFLIGFTLLWIFICLKSFIGSSQKEPGEDELRTPSAISRDLF